MLPGPYVSVGLDYAKYRTHERMRALMQELWR